MIKEKRTAIIISSIFIFLITLFLIGISYAYFLAKVEGNTEEYSFIGVLSNLAIRYGDGNGILRASGEFKPGRFVGTKEFSVKNTGDARTAYYVVLENVTNELTRFEDLVLSIRCIASCETTSCEVCYGTSGEIPFPKNNKILLRNSIGYKVTHNYFVTLRYKDMGVDQSVDMGKKFAGKINIMAATGE